MDHGLEVHRLIQYSSGKRCRLVDAPVVVSGTGACYLHHDPVSAPGMNERFLPFWERGIDAYDGKTKLYGPFDGFINGGSDLECEVMRAGTIAIDEAAQEVVVVRLEWFEHLHLHTVGKLNLA